MKEKNGRTDKLRGVCPVTPPRFLPLGGYKVTKFTAPLQQQPPNWTRYPSIQHGLHPGGARHTSSSSHCACRCADEKSCVFPLPLGSTAQTACSSISFTTLVPPELFQVLPLRLLALSLCLYLYLSPGVPPQFVQILSLRLQSGLTRLCSIWAWTLLQCRGPHPSRLSVITRSGPWYLWWNNS